MTLKQRLSAIVEELDRLVGRAITGVVYRDGETLYRCDSRGLIRARQLAGKLAHAIAQMPEERELLDGDEPCEGGKHFLRPLETRCLCGLLDLRKPVTRRTAPEFYAEDDPEVPQAPKEQP